MRDLRVAYQTQEGPLPAVRGVDLVVREGEVVGVAGESGCGKSTLVSTVLRLQPKDATVEGEVLVLGGDVQTMKWGELRARALGRRLDHLPGGVALTEPRAAGRPSDRRAHHGARAEPAPSSRSTAGSAELLDQVGLSTARARSYPHQLSGGQKQRVMIAMALACRPRLIVADEPTTALDVMVQAQILDLLGDLVRDLGVGLLIISHDLSVLADVCDRVLVMYAGRVVESGTAHQVFTDPLHPYTAALSGAFPRIGDPAARYAPAGLEGDPPDPRYLPEGCSFAPRCPRAVDRCSDAEPPPVEVAPGRPVACIRVGEP